MTRVLITGANSFIGTNFIKYSRFRDVDQVSLHETLPGDIDFSKFDVVLHLAAIVHKTKKFPDKHFFKVNRDLCLQVAEISKKAGVKQFIFLSTLKVYGDSVPKNHLRNEDSECFPEDAYGRSKYEAEVGLKKLESTGFTVSLIRTPLVYGEGVKANMISLIRLVERFPVLPLGNVDNKRNFTYTENLVGFIDQIIIKRASGTFITMDDNAVSTTELVKYLSESLGKKVKLFRLPQVIIRLGIRLVPLVFERLFCSLEVDNSKTKARLDYEPPYTTEEGVRKMVSWFRNEKNTLHLNQNKTN